MSHNDSFIKSFSSGILSNDISLFLIIIVNNNYYNLYFSIFLFLSLSPKINRYLF
jgi:hypothetical protein